MDRVADNQQFIMRLLVALVYRDQTHYLKGAALELGIPERTAVRYSGYFLKNIAFAMGYISTF